MRINILVTMVITLLLTACGKDEKEGGQEEIRTPIHFIANIQPQTASRTTVNNNWGRLSDRNIAIRIDGVTKQYTVSENGDITSEDPFYWDGQTEIAVEAWYPYQEGVKPETLVVYADQSIRENYEKSDYLEGAKVGMTADRNVLTFTHRTTQMMCDFTASSGESAVTRILLHGLSHVNEGSSVVMNSEHCALVVPQTIPLGTEFLEVLLEDGTRHVFTLEEELDLKKGIQKKAEVAITPEGLEVVFTDISSWVGDTETPDGQSPAINPDNDNKGWNGNNNGEDINGDSSIVYPDGDTSGWTGDDEDVQGNTSGTATNNGNANWSIDEEDVIAQE